MTCHNNLRAYFTSEYAIVIKGGYELGLQETVATLTQADAIKLMASLALVIDAVEEVRAA